MSTTRAASPAKQAPPSAAVGADLARPDAGRRPAGRPRQVSDAAIYEAGLMVMADLGVSGLTLARVAERVGVTAAAVRQRYGSKRGLTLAMARERQRQTTQRFETARSTYASPLAALEAAFCAELGLVERPDQVAHIFSAYTELVSDPEIGELFGGEIREMTRQTARFLRDAAVAGELRVAVTDTLAGAVLAAAEGTMLLWALAPDGDLRERVVAAIRAVVTPEPA